MQAVFSNKARNAAKHRLGALVNLPLCARHGGISAQIIAIDRLARHPPAPCGIKRIQIEQHVLANLHARRHAKPLFADHRRPVELCAHGIERAVRPDEAFQNRLPIPLRAGKPFLAPALVGVADGIRAAEDVRRAVIQRKQGCQRVRRQNVVRIHKGQPFAPRRRHARVSRARYAAVFLMDHANPRIRPRKRIERRTRPVRRSVVNRDQFPIRHGLCPYAFRRAHKGCFAVVARHHDGYHCGFSLSARKANAASPHFLFIVWQTAISG